MNRGHPLENVVLQPVVRPLDVAEELKRRWRNGQPELESFLADWTSSSSRPSLSPRELAALVGIDQHQRYRRGERPAAEDYLLRFPQIATDEELALDVIYGEFLLREELGEAPASIELQQRFPDLAETLQDQIEFHKAMAATARPSSAFQDTHRVASSIQANGTLDARLPAHLKRFVPGYEILSELGRGGMGVVYKARQLSLNRLVALKMVRAGDGGSEALLARFQAEAEAVARLHHPNIVQIYDYGEQDGLPYLALELVAGGPLSAALGGRPISTRQSAEMVVTLARAVQFAHEHGIVHRDLKPANVLIASEHAESPGGTAVKITDFGLAKVFHEGDASRTQTGTIVGTPSYMAPEQARGQPQLVGPAADVYALGAILYELLTGRPPFQAGTPIETLHQVLTTEVVSPARHVSRLPRDLVTIVVKCLQKEPRHRFASAAELAEDLERFLGNRPIRARRTGGIERTWRWSRRNPALAGLLGSVAALLIAVAVVSIVYSVRLGHQLTVTSGHQQREADARKLSEIRLWESQLGEIRALQGSRRVGERTKALAIVDGANELLDTIGRTPERVRELRNSAIALLASPDFHEVRALAAENVKIASLSSAADRYAVVSNDGKTTVHRLSTGELICSIPFDPVEWAVRDWIELSADGQYAFTVGSHDVVTAGSALTESSQGANIWRCTDDPPKRVWTGPGVNFVAFSPDSRQAAVNDPIDGMRLIDLETGESLGTLGKRAAICTPKFHAASRRIAVITLAGVEIIDWNSGAVVTELPVQITKERAGIAWHPSGRAVAVSGVSEGTALWDVSEPRLLMTYPHGGQVWYPHFSRDGGLLLTLDAWTYELRIWNTGTGQEVLRSAGFEYWLVDDQAMNEGEFYLLLQNGRLSLWRLEPGLATNPLLSGPYDSLGGVYSIAVSPDSRLLAMGRNLGFEIWDLETYTHTAHAGVPNIALAFVPNGDLIVSCLWGLFRWPRHDSASANGANCRFGPPERLSGPMAEWQFGMSAAGDAFAVHLNAGWRIVRPGGADTPIDVQPSDEDDPRCLALSPDGRWLALANWFKPGVGVWDAATGERIVKLTTKETTGFAVFSPDGRWLATTPDGVRLWSVGDWKPAVDLHAAGSRPSGMPIAFSPDSSVLAVSQPNSTTRFVDPVTGTNWADLIRPDSRFSSDVTFSPDQSLLIEVPAGEHPEARIWDLTEIRRELARRRLDWPAEVLAVRPYVETASRPRKTTVVLDSGNLVNQQAALELIAAAGDRKDAAARESLEKAIELDPDNAYAHNHLAWLLVAGPEELRDPKSALPLARRGVELAADRSFYWNTLGVALYRNALYSESLEILEQSLERGGDDTAGFDLIFLALCQARLGNAAAAADYYDRASTWLESHQSSLQPAWRDELALFFAEAESAGITIAD